MRYLGGKARLAKEIAAVMAPAIAEASCYIEPFVGGGSILCEIDHPVRLAGDAFQPLIAMWNALVHEGWQPPGEVSAEERLRLRQADNPHDPMTAFAGFGCGFGGDYRAGYAKARPREKPIAAQSRDSLLRQVESLKMGGGGAQTCDLFVSVV